MYILGKSRTLFCWSVKNGTGGGLGVSQGGQVEAGSWRTVKAINEFIQLGNREPWKVF